MSTQAPAATEERTLRITGMTCAACQHHVQRALESVPGVASASVNLMAHTARILTAPSVDQTQILTAVHNAGYKAAPLDATPTPGHSSENTLGLRAILSLAAGAFAMLLSMPLMMSSSATNDPLTRILTPVTAAALMHLPATPIRWLLCILSLAVMLFAAREIYTAAWRAALHRSTNMNTLVALGTLAAFVSSLAAADVYYEAVIK
jgi:Cu+-exporting ATPase